MNRFVPIFGQIVVLKYAQRDSDTEKITAIVMTHLPGCYDNAARALEQTLVAPARVVT